MKTRQAKTITKLVEIKRRSAEAAEAAHVAANAVTVAAEAAKQKADGHWMAAVDANEAIGTVADLEDRDVQIRSLRRAVEAAEREVAMARMKEASLRQAMTDARIELRRFETWLERDAAAQSAEVRRVERLADDEVAARIRESGMKPIAFAPVDRGARDAGELEKPEEAAKKKAAQAHKRGPQRPHAVEGTDPSAFDARLSDLMEESELEDEERLALARIAEPPPADPPKPLVLPDPWAAFQEPPNVLPEEATGGGAAALADSATTGATEKRDLATLLGGVASAGESGGTHAHDPAFDAVANDAASGAHEGGPDLADALQRIERAGQEAPNGQGSATSQTSAGAKARAANELARHQPNHDKEASKPKADMSADAARVAAVDPSVVAPFVPTSASVDKPTGSSVKTVTDVSVSSPGQAAENGAAGQAVRAAEQIGHKRALMGEAHGRILVPELGLVEVQARLEASRVEVHVHAEDEHAKRVIAAHASDMRAHVRVEVPNAVVHVERPIMDFTAGNGLSRDLGRDAETGRDPREQDGADDREDHGRRQTAFGARARFVL